MSTDWLLIQEKGIHDGFSLVYSTPPPPKPIKCLPPPPAAFGAHLFILHPPSCRVLACIPVCILSSFRASVASLMVPNSAFLWRAEPTFIMFGACDGPQPPAMADVSGRTPASRPGAKQTAFNWA